MSQSIYTKKAVIEMLVSSGQSYQTANATIQRFDNAETMKRKNLHKGYEKDEC